MDRPTDASPDSAAPQPPHNNEPTEAEETNTRRIVVLGKTGAGKSSTCNTIFGEALFKVDHSANSGTSECAAVNRSVNGRSITLIDTPGFFDTEKSEGEQRDEITKCVIECAPGPHAFLILLKVEKFTKQEQQTVDKILNTFSEEAFKYAVVVFTHGDQLPEGKKIEDFVKQNKGLRDLVRKCGGRCHVIDNKYWNQQDEYRSNQVQVERLLNTIDNMLREKSRGYYTNEMLQTVYRMIITFGMTTVYNFFKMSAGITTGALLGGLLGVPAMIIFVVAKLRKMPTLIEVGKVVVGAAGAAGGATGGAAVAAKGAAGRAATTGLYVVAGAVVAAGAAGGGYIGYHEAEKAESVTEAIKDTAKAVLGQNYANIYYVQNQ